MAELIIENEQNKIDVTKALTDLIKAVCEEVMAEEECGFDAQISVTLTDDERIRNLNREHRGIDRATDVLSFPMLSFDGDEADARYDYDGDAVLLGDIVISLERAAAQAEEYNHSMRRETAFLTAHSMLHLLGYDHIDSEGDRIMRKKQDKVLTALNITRKRLTGET